jgi:hypothetical protein
VRKYAHYSGNIEKELNMVLPNQRKYAIESFKESYDVLEVKY